MLPDSNAASTWATLIGSVRSERAGVLPGATPASQTHAASRPGSAIAAPTCSRSIWALPLHGLPDTLHHWAAPGTVSRRATGRTNSGPPQPLCQRRPSLPGGRQDQALSIAIPIRARPTIGCARHWSAFLRRARRAHIAPCRGRQSCGRLRESVCRRFWHLPNSTIVLVHTA